MDIKPGPFDDKGRPNILYIKFGFKLWDNSNVVIHQGESKFYAINALLAWQGAQVSLASLIILGLALM